MNHSGGSVSAVAENGIMFRMEFIEIGPELTVRIEGRFVGYFPDEARSTIARRKIPAGLIVDISDVTYVDLHGEEALTWLGQIGARFVADSSYALDLCERLHLRIARNRNGHRVPNDTRTEEGLENGP